MNDLDFDSLMATIERVPDPELKAALKIVAQAAINNGPGLEDRNDTTWGIWEGDDGADDAPARGIFLGIYRY